MAVIFAPKEERVKTTYFGRGSSTIRRIILIPVYSGNVALKSFIPKGSSTLYQVHSTMFLIQSIHSAKPT